jgi:hypothetical protein
MIEQGGGLARGHMALTGDRTFPCPVQMRARPVHRAAPLPRSPRGAATDSHPDTVTLMTR